MDCVVLDGDLVSRKGALTGGYVDTRQSKLAYYRQKAELAEQIKTKESEISGLEKEIRDVDAQLTAVLNDLQKYETRVKRNRDTYEQMRADASSRKIEIERFERQRPQKEASIESLRLDIEQLESKRDMLKTELGTELVKQLSIDEQKVVDDLNDKIHKLNTDLKVGFMDFKKKIIHIIHSKFIKIRKKYLAQKARYKILWM
jgi:structural maintenance of chromosome 3 (chondroitin sulfate proteoglycan 6)